MNFISTEKNECDKHFLTYVCVHSACFIIVLWWISAFCLPFNTSGEAKHEEKEEAIPFFPATSVYSIHIHLDLAPCMADNIYVILTAAFSSYKNE